MKSIEDQRVIPLKLPLLRGLLPIAVSLVVLWLLRDKMASVDVDAITRAAHHISYPQWITAIALTVFSLHAVSQYDRLVAAHIGLDVPRKLILGAGWRATAISQVLGYGVITGALTRWRALGSSAGLSLWDCSRLTVGVTLSFFAGWLVLASLSVFAAPTGSLQGLPDQIAQIGLVATLILFILSTYPTGRWASLLPGPRFGIQIISFTALDTVAASAILFVFLPEGYVPFLTLYTAFLLALSAGMISGLPGGLGAFEMCLITLIAPTDPTPLLTAILGYRMVYYAAPATLAGMALLIPSRKSVAQATGPVCRADIPPDLAGFAPPEADLTAQRMLQIRQSTDHTSAALWHRARNCDVVLADPFGPDVTADSLRDLRRSAAQAGRGLVVYKSSEHIAALGRACGMFAVRIGSEAIVIPAKYSKNGSARKTLRRKLRRAASAGVSVMQGGIDYDTMARIDAAWQSHSGRPRSFSMGYLGPRIVARQKHFTAFANSEPIAFITLLCAQDEWTLDLMRMMPDCPDGVMHALIDAAVEAARQAQVKTVSLAAAPFYSPEPAATLTDGLVSAIFRRSPQLKGLAQFKSSFAPEWRPRYMILGQRYDLPFAVMDLWQLIRNSQPHDRTDMQTPHDHYGFYEFASPADPCHALQRMTLKEYRDEPDRHRCPQRSNERIGPPSG